MGIPWEAWSDEAAPGQVELNFVPAGAVTAADRVFRAKQVIKEVALDRGVSATFMAKPTEDFGNGMHVHHSLRRDGTPVFFDARPTIDGRRDAALDRRLGRDDAGRGIAPGPDGQLLSPHGRLRGRAHDADVVRGEQVDGPPRDLPIGQARTRRAPRRRARTSTSTSRSRRSSQAASRASTGRSSRLRSTAASRGRAPRPRTAPGQHQRAAEELASDKLLAGVLGSEFVDYWLHNRRWEWLMFHTGGGDAQAKTVTDWELNRYFELV